jgi:putative transposase
VNDKRVQRLWREEGLKVPYRTRKRPLRGPGKLVGAMCPIRPNVLWALDFQFDQTRDGRTCCGFLNFPSVDHRISPVSWGRWGWW